MPSVEGGVGCEMCRDGRVQFTSADYDGPAGVNGGPGTEPCPACGRGPGETVEPEWVTAAKASAIGLVDEILETAARMRADHGRRPVEVEVLAAVTAAYGTTLPVHTLVAASFHHHPILSNDDGPLELPKPERHLLVKVDEDEWLPVGSDLFSVSDRRLATVAHLLVVARPVA